jgi:hypothetical protein
LLRFGSAYSAEPDYTLLHPNFEVIELDVLVFRRLKALVGIAPATLSVEQDVIDLDRALAAFAIENVGFAQRESAVHEHLKQAIALAWRVQLDVLV